MTNQSKLTVGLNVQSIKTNCWFEWESIKTNCWLSDQSELTVGWVTAFCHAPGGAGALIVAGAAALIANFGAWPSGRENRKLYAYFTFNVYI